MRVLCFLGIRDAWAMVEQALRQLNPANLELLLVYVVDEEQREGLLGQLGGLGRRPKLPERHVAAMAEAEDQAGATAMRRAAEAALAGGVDPRRIERRLVRGHPGEVIVALAEQAQCGLIVLRATDEVKVRVPRGPASIGHAARFIIDHAPCDVLVIREPAG